MIAALSLLVKFGPWIGMALAALAALFVHKNAQVKIAAAGQQVAQAQTSVAQAQTQVAEQQDADAQANATAAAAGAQALKERTNAENDIAALPVGAAASQLLDQWSADTPSATSVGTGSSDKDKAG